MFGGIHHISHPFPIQLLTRHGVDLVVVAPRHESRVGLDEATVNNNMTIRLPGCLLPISPSSIPSASTVEPSRRAADLIYLASPASVGFPLLTQIRQLPRSSSYPSWPAVSSRSWESFSVFYLCSDIGRYLEGTGVPRDRMVRLGRGVDTIMFHPFRRDDAYRRQLAPNGETILVCVCRLGLEKGFDFLARVAVQLVAAALPFKLLIVGGNRNPAAEDNLRWLFEPVEDRVVFTGFLTGEPLARAYAVGSVSALFHHRNLRARRAGGHGQRGAGDRPRSRWSIGHCVPRKDGLSGGVNRFASASCRCRATRTYAHGSPPPPANFAEDTTWEKISRRDAGQLADALKERRRQRQPQRKLLYTRASTDSLLPSRSIPPVTDNGGFPVQRRAGKLRLHRA
ncbi:hypothetical protein Egran_00290, partial [Elaphomyces granulatus]